MTNPKLAPENISSVDPGDSHKTIKQQYGDSKNWLHTNSLDISKKHTSSLGISYGHTLSRY